MAEFQGEPHGGGRRIAIAASRFNEPITEKLVDGTLRALVEQGVELDDIDVAWVPGAWELPPLARRLASADRYHAIVAIGAVIRGETAHFDYIAGEAARGLAAVQADFDIPIGFGVLTCETDAQAEARAGGEHGNKGAEAAMVALEMADLFERLDAATES